MGDHFIFFNWPFELEKNILKRSELITFKSTHFMAEAGTQKGKKMYGEERWYCRKAINLLKTLSSINFNSLLRPSLYVLQYLFFMLCGFMHSYSIYWVTIEIKNSKYLKPVFVTHGVYKKPHFFSA